MINTVSDEPVPGVKAVGRVDAFRWAGKGVTKNEMFVGSPCETDREVIAEWAIALLDLAGGSRLAGEATGLSNNAGTDNLEMFKVSKAFKIFFI